MFNQEIETALWEAFSEWRNCPDIFDFYLPTSIKLEIKPASCRARHGMYANQTTGRCWMYENRIIINYGTDKEEAVHTLLHEMCHLNRLAHHHDKVFNKSFAHAAEQITGKKFNYMQPMRKLDTEIAQAFGSTARANAVAERQADRKNKNKANLEKVRAFRPGDDVYVLTKDSFYNRESWVRGTIKDINPLTARCHVIVAASKEIVNRKVNNIITARKNEGF
jgi:hypothetical protein